MIVAVLIVARRNDSGSRKKKDKHTKRQWPLRQRGKGKGRDGSEILRG